MQPPPPLPKADGLTARVPTIVDGDTLAVRLEGGTIQVRSIGANTPETAHPKKGVEPFGKEANGTNRQLVEGKAVRLELVRQGYAQVATFCPM